ncbi:dinB family protein [Mariprofundus micogutta]|uniref:DinB family protein n=1 Tax=Mariprofundus micogutta TaxID=1921010 RepID=A0A1L8CLN3_9PROT|nr:DinB family protein [Mariprofundus micogutta]GAV19827.1 dinB family protein [Mariprofundus micogutta]
MTEYLQRMAVYNRWMNDKLFAKASELSDEALCEDRGAFFSSISGTLNHIMVADLFWLSRFAFNKHCREALLSLADFPRPESLRDILFEDFNELTAARAKLDALIIDFCQTWTENLLAQPIRYRNTAGEKQERQLGPLLQHFFNHQTHHRGQVTTLLFQAGIDPGPTDLLVMMMEDK